MTDKESLLKDAEQVFSKGLVAELKSRGHDFIEQGRDGAFIFDSEGNKYIDCYTSAATYNLGRKHPDISEELERASHETDQGNFLFISEEKARLVKKLTDFIPGNFTGVLLSAVRGEAFDAACKLARGYTKKTEIISVDGGYYGQTGFAISLSSRENKHQFGKLIPDTRIIPHGDMDAAREAMGKNTAAFALELVQAENHCRTAEKNYIKELRALCDKHGALLIFDETQSGFGRTGYKFAMEYFNIYPDILIFGEALSGGVFPVSGMVFTREAKSFFEEHPLIHLHTFGGHDVGCRVFYRALEVYEQVKPWENARQMGDKLRLNLQKIVDQNPGGLESVSGLGLLLSIKLKSPEMAKRFCMRARQNGMIVVPGEIDKACVPIRPILTISDKEVDIISNCISTVVSGL